MNVKDIMSKKKNNSTAMVIGIGPPGGFGQTDILMATPPEKKVIQYRSRDESTAREKEIKVPWLLWRIRIYCTFGSDDMRISFDSVYSFRKDPKEQDQRLYEPCLPNTYGNGGFCFGLVPQGTLPKNASVQHIVNDALIRYWDSGFNADLGTLKQMNRSWKRKTTFANTIEGMLISLDMERVAPVSIMDPVFAKEGRFFTGIIEEKKIVYDD